MRLEPALLAVVVTGCAQSTAPTWYRDVQPIVQRKCGTCHDEGGIGPFPLKTLADWKAVEPAALAALRDGRMPPFPARTDCAEYSPTQAMPAEYRETIEKWVASGGAEGDPKTFRELPGAADRLTRVDLSLPLSVPYTPTHAPDQYRCYLVDWPITDPQFVTGYELRPGAKDLVHHADIFFIHPDAAAAWQAKDDADPAPGWECYDIPFADEGGWIGTWVPGLRGVDFPEGTGLRIPVGGKIYVQVHYNLPSGNSESDVSTLDLRLAPRVDQPAGVQAVSDPSWLTQHTMNIPAGEKDVTHSFVVDPTLLAPLISRTFVGNKPLTLYATTMHMHQLGQSAFLKVHRADGGTECVVDIPRWDFHWQLSYTLAKPVVINPGDQLEVSCTWDNTQTNQPVIDGMQAMAVDRNWGARTQDEMCVGGIYVTEEK